MLYQFQSCNLPSQVMTSHKLISTSNRTNCSHIKNSMKNSKSFDTYRLISRIPNSALHIKNELAILILKHSSLGEFMCLTIQPNCVSGHCVNAAFCAMQTLRGCLGSPLTPSMHMHQWRAGLQGVKQLFFIF